MGTLRYLWNFGENRECPAESFSASRKEKGRKKGMGGKDGNGVIGCVKVCLWVEF